MQVRFTLTGRMPLLMHADDVEKADELEAWRKDQKNRNKSKAGDDRSPPWTWHTYLYSDGEHIALPSENIMVALRQAGAQKILKKQKTFKEITQSGLLITEEFCRFTVNGEQIKLADIDAMRDNTFAEQADAVKEMGFRLFIKRARVGQSKHVRVRPRFDSWQVDGTVLIQKDEITFDILEELFSIAGSVGLSDWRPGCKTPGPYGMFDSVIQRV